MILLPIGDENPRERTPYVNYALLAANIVVFVLFCFPTPGKMVLVHYAMWPGQLEGHTLLTSMFLHANLAHLIGNMVFLWIFGDNVEDRLGHLGYAVFYLGCGLAADAAHILSNPGSLIPTLGASGAISGVVGAYAVFFPRHRVKLFIWLWVFWDIYLIPAFWWIGFWFLQQVVFSVSDYGGGVAYLAHIGGFVAGAGVGALVRWGLGGLRARVLRPGEPRGEEGRSAERRPFITIDDEPGIHDMMEEDPEDRYAVLRLGDDLHGVGRIAEITTGVTGRDSAEVAERLERTRGMIARGIPRVEAEKIQRALHAQGHPSAIVLDHRSNHPPPPSPADSASWDDRLLRLAVGGQVVPVAWPAPFLYVGARVTGRTFIDILVNRRVAYRVPEGIAMARVDPLRRRESDAELRDLAEAVLDHHRGAAVNEGVSVLAGHGSWGWLSFRNPSDFDDYLFWIYNLTLSRSDLHRL